MATDTQNLLQWLISLLNDDNARQAFTRNPDQYLRDHGYGDVTSGDLHDSLCLLSDGERSGHRDHSGDDGHHHPAPHHYERGEDAAHYLREYVTNNYSYVDHRDTTIDNSVHQRVDTGGGDFGQHIDNDTAIASGDGSTAVGGDNQGNISSAGHDDTTAFGHGDATNADFSHSDFGSGGSVNLGPGSSHGHAEADTTLHATDNSTRVHDDNHSVQLEHSDTDSHNVSHFDDHGHSHNDVQSHSPTHVDDLHIDAH